MIEMTDLALDVVQRSYVLHTRARSMLGEDVLADDVPIAGGSLEIDRTVRVPEQLSLTVPRIADGVNWDASGSADHPLAPYGQTVVLELGVEITRGNIEWLQRGEYLISETSVDGDAVTVGCVGLLALIEEARFTTPYQATGTFRSTIRSLVEPALTVRFGSGLPTNRSVPTASLTVDEDRMGALEEVLAAWPADAYVDSTGVLYVVPLEDSETASLTLTDGAGGTVVSWAGASSRDGAATLVVARGQDATGAQVQGVAYDDDPDSPLLFGGPFNPLPVPFFYSSPLLTTQLQCRTAARTILARRKRSSSRLLTATCVPHPGLETGDRVTVDGVDGVAAAIVEVISLPITPDGLPMMLTLRAVA